MRSTASGLMAIGVLLYSGVVLAAVDPALTCQASKLRLTAKYGSCRLSAESKSVKTGNPVDFSKCDLANFNDAEAKASGACQTIGDRFDLEQRVTYHTNAIAELLGGGDAADPYSPASGQTTSYGAGDDGDIQAGATLSYMDNGDGTITDRNTGLMWEKKVAYSGGSANCTSEAGTCANPHHADNRYLWTVNSSPYTAYNGAAVTIFLDQLNNRCDKNTTLPCTTESDCAVPTGSCGFAGYRDWRLPNIKELVGIVDFDVPNPGPPVDSAFNGGNCDVTCTDIADSACSCTVPSIYWSASTYATNPPIAWYVDFFDGSMFANTKYDNHFFVRAVRGGS